MILQECAIDKDRAVWRQGVDHELDQLWAIMETARFPYSGRYSDHRTSRSAAVSVGCPCASVRDGRALILCGMFCLFKSLRSSC